MIIIIFFFEAVSCYVAQASLKLVILLLRELGLRQVMTCMVQSDLFKNIRLWAQKPLPSPEFGS
jgi:hypothetical protein